MLAKDFSRLWRPVIWVPIYVISIAAGIAHHYWTQWAIDYSNRVTSELRPIVPSIDFVMPYTSRNWLPLPWAEEHTLGEASERIVSSITDKFRELRNDSMGSISWDRFQLLATQWNARRILCTDFDANGIHFDDCTNASQMPVAWIERFERHFDQDYYIAENGYGLTFGRRKSRLVEYCNVTPIESKVYSVDVLASPELSAFYRKALTRTIGPLYQQPIQEIEPGDCVKRRVVAYDADPQSLFNATPVDVKKEAWFFENWRRYHATWLNDSEQVQALIAYFFNAVQASTCMIGHDGGWLAMEALNECNQQLPVTLAMDLAYPSSLFFGANYPGFSGYEYYVDEDSVLNRLALDQILEEARTLAHLVTAQYELAKVWSDQQPRFELGGYIEDTSGPFVLGVSIANLPRKTIYDELVELPNTGILYQINDRLVYSVADVHEALTALGDSLGIKALVDLSIYSETPTVVDAVYRTRFRFNTYASQNFNTNISELEQAIHGFLPWTNLWCLEEKQCAWMKDQELAYARQIDPERFKAVTFTGELVGSIITPFATLKMFKWFNRGARLSVLSRVALGGLSEGATEFGYGWANQAPSANMTYKFESATANAKTGFLYGAAFGFLPH
ncbi:hypothetical protein [Glaciecola sp. 1036]|uniref:hypothetical protein n=1 Tax=Alteromonadaceae TaxID=72275 RepID=UPI003D08A442